MAREHVRKEQGASHDREQDWREILNATGQAIFIHDAATGCILDVNDWVLEMFGVTREEALNMSPDANSRGEPPFSGKEALALLRKAAEEGPQLFEWQARRKNGTVFWCEVSLRRIEAGGQGRVLAVVRDITGRKQAEEALRASEAVLQESQRVARLGHYEFNVIAQSWTSSEVLDEIFGIGAGFARSLEGWLDLVHPKQREEMRAYLTGHVLGGGHPFDKQYRIVRPKDGVVRWVHGLGRLEFNTAGQPVRMHGTIQDITEHLQVEEALRRSQADLELAQAAGHVGSWISELQPAGRLLWSAETCRIFGFRKEEFDGRRQTFLDIVHPEDRPALEAAVQAAMAGGKPYDLEHRVRRRDGVARWVHEKAELERDATGHPLRLMGIVQDITERRQLEEQLRHLQRMESVGQLAAGVAHDFNNILTVINGNASLLAPLLQDKPACLEWLNQITAAGERAANLTRQLLLFSRKQQMQPKQVNLNELTSNLTKMLGRVLGEDITLEFSYDTDLPNVHADPSMLEQVILNLAVNARDAMPQGGRLHIATTTLEFTPEHPSPNPEARPGRFVRLAVSDTGCGIPPEIRGRIFEPFFTTKEVGKGTGLGLATVYGIVKQHEGWIELESAVQRGAAFLIHLPAAAGARSAQEQAAAPQASPGRGETIFVVEDEPSVRNLVCQMLTRGGYKIVVASSGAEALRLPPGQLDRVDLLLTDLVMPGGTNGRELARSLRKTRPRLKVIYCSGYSPEIAGGWAPAEEEASFLQKPFSQYQLLQAVAACLHP